MNTRKRSASNTLQIETYKRKKFVNEESKNKSNSSNSKSKNYSEKYDSSYDEELSHSYNSDEEMISGSDLEYNSDNNLNNISVKTKKTEISKLTSEFHKKTYIKSVNKNVSKSRSKSRSKSFLNKIEEENEIEDKINFLPCREKEQDFIYNFIKKGLDTSGSYTGLYISGMPGTGKTACVTTVINNLRIEIKNSNNHINPFSVLELNGMKITNPNNVYKYIYEHIFSDGRTKNIKKCTSILDNFFKNRSDFSYKVFLNNVTNPHLILIIDEIDCLINKKQMLLYNIFNWTTYPHSKLIIISISNTLDLPEKLQPKISSRMGNNRLSFKPYLKDELVKILSVKIDNFELFSDDAIKLSSMKVAAVSGDLRRILRICKRAKEIFDLEYKDIRIHKIEKSHILKAIEELYDAKVQKVIRNLQFYEKITLGGILFEMKLQMNNRVHIPNIYERFKYFYIKIKNINCKVTFEEFMIMIYNLAKMQIISFSDTSSTNFVNNTVMIKFYPDEFTTAVEKDDLFQEILKELA